MNLLLTLFGIICGLVGLYGFFVLSFGYSHGPSDFVQDYAAGHALRHGSSIYGEEIATYTHKLLGFTGHENFHPPMNALFFAPLSLIPYNISFLLWSGLTLLLYLWILSASYRAVRPPLPPIFVFGLGLVWWPFLHGVELGQSSMLIAASIVGGWAALRRGRDGLGGALLGLAATIKLFPLFLGAYLIITKNHRALLSMGVVFCTITAVAAGVVGSEDSLRYVNEIIPRDVAEWSGFPLNAALYGLIVPLTTANHFVAPLALLPFDVVIGVIKILSVLLALGAFFRGRALVVTGHKDHAFALLLVTMLVISPISWVHIFPVLVPILLALWRAVSETPMRFLALGILVCLSIPNYLLVTKALAIWTPLPIPGVVYAGIALSTYGLFALFCLLFLRRTGIPVVIPVSPRHNTNVL